MCVRERNSVPIEWGYVQRSHQYVEGAVMGIISTYAGHCGVIGVFLGSVGGGGGCIQHLLWYLGQLHEVSFVNSNVSPVFALLCSCSVPQFCNTGSTSALRR